MALPSAPSRDDIYYELTQSNYRNGGTDENSLKEMWNYVFGSGSYSRDGFGGYGIPSVGNLSLSGGANHIDVTIDLTDNGGHSCTIIAEYWESGGSTGTNPSYQTIASGVSSQSQYEGIIGSLDASTTYSVRCFAYNLWNNSGNNPEAPNISPWYDYSSTEQAQTNASSSGGYDYDDSIDQPSSISGAYLGTFGGDHSIRITLDTPSGQGTDTVLLQAGNVTQEVPTQRPETIQTLNVPDTGQSSVFIAGRYVDTINNTAGPAQTDEVTIT
jgi:hypothetical protein